MDRKTLKILILGDYAVGKTSLLLRYTGGNFDHISMPTLGIGFHKKVLEIDSEYYSVDIWDTAGQERFRNIPLSYYNKADGIALTFDLTSRSSFENIRAWATQISARALEACVVVLIGTKIDISTQVVTPKEINELSSEMKMRYFATSSKENINVVSTFDFLAKNIARMLKKTQLPEARSYTLYKNLPKQHTCCGKH